MCVEDPEESNNQKTVRRNKTTPLQCNILEKNAMRRGGCDV